MVDDAPVVVVVIGCSEEEGEGDGELVEDADDDDEDDNNEDFTKWKRRLDAVTGGLLADEVLLPPSNG